MVESQSCDFFRAYLHRADFGGRNFLDFEPLKR